MHARPEISERLLCSKLRHWARIGSSPHLYSKASVSAARRNYSRLFSRHADLARRINLGIASAYPSY